MNGKDVRDRLGIQVLHGERALWTLPLLLAAACAEPPTPSPAVGANQADASLSAAATSTQTNAPSSLASHSAAPSSAAPADSVHDASDVPDDSSAMDNIEAGPDAAVADAELDSAAEAGHVLGPGTPELCSFAIEGTLSPAISTVGVVHWSTDLAGLTEARIEFTLDNPARDEINRGSGGAIDIEGETHRALLLGLKPARSYTYHIVAKSGDTECRSADQTLTTGDDGVPKMTRTVSNALVPTPGFIVTVVYESQFAYILDTDGAVVWWAKSPSRSSRARMDWEAQNMWIVQANPLPGFSGEVRRVSMDGTDVLENVPGLEDAHHDLAVLPGGVVATFLWTDLLVQTSDLVERSADGSIKIVTGIDDHLFAPSDRHHANSLAYHLTDDSYTVGDLNSGGYVKLTRDGDMLWQLLDSCENASESRCATGPLTGAHGHHLLDDGTFLFFTGIAWPGMVYEYALSESSGTFTATPVWSYDAVDTSSQIFGDVQRLPNGNTLVMFSVEGQIRELSPTGDVVQTIVYYDQVQGLLDFGYADFRETLYGPPLR